MSRLLIGGGALAGLALAQAGLARMFTPYMPDIALHAGMELVSKPRRALAIGRRPGDLEFHIGGTLFLLARNQSRVTAAVLTQGERSRRPPAIGEIRSKEQRAAAAALGVDLLQFSLPEGALQEGPGLQRALKDAWARANPEVVFAPDPNGPLFNPNSDDAAIANALLDIARESAAANARVYLYATRRANVLIDITETIQEKVSAVQCHRSQLKGPDGASRWYVRSASRLSRGRTPAMYTGGPLPARVSGPAPAPFGLDATLRMRSAMNRGLLRLPRSRAGRYLINRSLRAAHPRIALAAGAELLSRPRKVLAVTAHPDDLEFFAGGVLKRLAQAGSDIHALVLTDGEKHGGHPHMGDIRRREQSRAASLQGFASVSFAELADFALPEDPRLESVVADAWRRQRPDTVLAFDPQELIARMANRDHKALGRTVMDLARSQFGLGARVYFYGTRQPNVLVDIDPVFDAKMRAVECHTSQLVYLTPREYQEAFQIMAEAYAAGTPCRFAEGLYRLV